MLQSCPKSKEYGNQWLLAIQSIDAIVDEKEKLKQQARLAEVLMSKLTSSQITKAPEFLEELAKNRESNVQTDKESNQK